MATKIKTYTTSDNLFFSDLNAEFDAIYSALNGGGSASVGDGTITEAKLTDDANPAVYFAELFGDGKVTSTTGFTYLSDTGLSVTITSGTAYVLQTTTSPDKLRRVDFASSSSHTVLDNTTNYLDLGADGVMDVSQASVPASDHTRILKIISSGGTISGTPTDEADRSFPENAGSKNHFSGLALEATSATAIVIASGLSCRDTTNNFNITTTAAITLDITNSVGALGLDQGSEGSNTWYAIVVIGDTSGVLPESAIFVTEAIYPSTMVLPSGYDIYRLVGWVRNDSSSDFLQGYQQGEHWTHYESHVILTAFGNATWTQATTAAFTAPNCRLWDGIALMDEVADNYAGTAYYTDGSVSSGTTGGVIMLQINTGGTNAHDASINSFSNAPCDASSSRYCSFRTNQASRVVDSAWVVGYTNSLTI